MKIQKSTIFALGIVAFWLTVVYMFLGWTLVFINLWFIVPYAIDLYLIEVIQDFLNSDYFDEEQDSDVHNSK